MFQDHQTISALSCFFDAAKVLRNPRQNNPFPTTSPKNPRFWEKSGIFWEKVRGRRKRELKSKEKGKFIQFSPKNPPFFPNVGKNRGNLGKNHPNNQHFNTPNIYNSKKMLIFALQFSKNVLKGNGYETDRRTIY